MAENLCHTALDKFKKKYGVIKDVSDKEFFTNSMHVPVWNAVIGEEPFICHDTLNGSSWIITPFPIGPSKDGVMFVG